MSGPFKPDGLVIKFDLSDPKEFLRIRPHRHPGDVWLHDPEEFDRTLDRETVIDRFALPEQESYDVSVVEVPAGETLQMGDVAAMAGQSGGGNLVEVLSRDGIPEAWVQDRSSLTELLER